MTDVKRSPACYLFVNATQLCFFVFLFHCFLLASYHGKGVEKVLKRCGKGVGPL
jgi:hypothetical protein